MTKRIFRALIGISLVVCLVGMATVFAVLYYYFENQITMEMESEVKYLVRKRHLCFDGRIWPAGSGTICAQMRSG